MMFRTSSQSSFDINFFTFNPLELYAKEVTLTNYTNRKTLPIFEEKNFIT